uniref:GP-PDE domain-containing protein n=1 Tax=viral metagenome TaxID=1070528 RepID=A0A6C0J8U3_9ZZZZ
MMKIIAHRGNLNGPCPETENTEEAIEVAIENGFDVEIDVWCLDGRLWLGHDRPDRVVDESFLYRNGSRLWIHCKNLTALMILRQDFQCFFHDKDAYTMTSYGVVWGNIDSARHPSMIAVMPELSWDPYPNCYGVCTDFPFKYLSWAKTLQSHLSNSIGIRTGP